MPPAIGSTRKPDTPEADATSTVANMAVLAITDDRLRRASGPAIISRSALLSLCSSLRPRVLLGASVSNSGYRSRPRTRAQQQQRAAEHAHTDTERDQIRDCQLGQSENAKFILVLIRVVLNFYIFIFLNWFVFRVRLTIDMHDRAALESML